MLKTLTHNEQETEAFGRFLSDQIHSGSVLCLYGELGAGKTAFVRGLAEGLGIQDPITSPTFTIIHEYDTNPPLFHLDAYRLSNGEELLEIGFEEYLGMNGIVVLEWADLVEDALPAHRLNVTITGSGEDPRTAVLEPCGTEYRKVVDLL